MKRVVAVGSGVAGSPFYWTFFFDAPTGDADAQAASDWVKDYFFAARAHFSSSLTILNEPEVQTVDVATGQVTAAETVTVFPLTGTATDLLPTQTQGNHRWNTGIFVNGRRLVGRTFLPTPPESDNDTDGTPSTAYAAAWVASAAAADAAHPLSRHVVWSRTHGVKSPVLGAGAVPNKWAFLRSRRD